MDRNSPDLMQGREARTLYEQLFESSPNAIIVTTQAGTISRVNAQAEHAFGYSREELTGRPIEILIPERYREAYTEDRAEHVTHPCMRPVGEGLELFGRRKDGSEFPVEVMLNTLETDEGRLVLSVIRDVTEQKRILENLHLTEQRFRLLVENAQDYAIFLLDADGNVVTWNAGAERLKGYRGDEIIGRPYSTFFASEDIATGTPAEALRIAATQGHFEAEGWRVRKDGSRFWANIVLTGIHDHRGAFIGFAKITRDFTERMEIERERELRSAEAREQAALLDLAHDSIIIRDLNDRIKYWNRGAEEKYGWKREEVIGKVTHTLLQTEFPQPFAAVDQQLRERHYWEGELVHRTKSGDVIVVASRQVLQLDIEGNPLAIFEINNDITIQKRAENALRQSEGHLRAVFEFSPDAIVTMNQAGKITAVNAQVERFFGYDRNELLGQSIEVLVPERFRQKHPAHRAEYSAHPRMRPMGVGLDLYGRRKDGSEFPVDITLGPMEAPEGRTVVSVIRDLSERRRYEEALKRSEQEKQYLEQELELQYQFDEIIGESTGLKEVLKEVEKVADTAATVLILGETGTGKDLIARAIHRLSPRRDRTLVKLNCAAIPTGLLESELFGHEKGAFTGAISQKIGRLELAHRGTLFLDEVGDLPPEIQPKLLRAIQEKEFERLGSTRTIPVDVRLIAATNRDLAKMVAEHQFRSDLYYRLRVFPISIPPLRERPEDIPLLVRYFVQKYASEMDRHIESIPPEAMHILTRWDWPGNIRELENFIERAVILTRGPVLRAPLAELAISEEARAEKPTLETANREHILRVMRETNGAIGGPNGAAERLGLKRTTLNSKLKKLGIERKDYM